MSVNNFYPSSYQYLITPDIVDESQAQASPGITYLGFWGGGPENGNAKSQAKFQIRKVTVNSVTGETITQYANGSDAFDKIWNNRAAYNYSFLR